MTDDRGIHKIVSFNRTFMELKWSLFVISGVCSRVLIVPLWNWNGGTTSHQEPPPRFNRTFMELKSKKN